MPVNRPVSLRRRSLAARTASQPVFTSVPIYLKLLSPSVSPSLQSGVELHDRQGKAISNMVWLQPEV